MKYQRHGLTKHPAYSSWSHMIERCTNPSVKHFHQYGGRGIHIHEPWKKSFVLFWADMGPSWMPGLSLDRIDTNGNYEPGNCRWSDHVVQAITRRKWAGTSSRFRGVCWHARELKWQVGITVNKNRRHIGYFDTEEAAARAYDAAARQYHGANARLNFP
jgi:hypothetical protein